MADVRLAMLSNQFWREAVSAWSGCMERRGYKVGDPEDALSLGVDLWRTVGRASKVTLAVADAACVVESRMGATGSEAFRDAIDAAVRKYEIEIEHYAADMVEASGRAALILEDPQSGVGMPPANSVPRRTTAFGVA